MHTTSESTSVPKRARAKSKSVTPKPVVTVKKSRVRKAADVAPGSAVTQLSDEQLQAMIATAAYYLAAARGFGPGHELEDWLAAERRIRAP